MTYFGKLVRCSILAFGAALALPACAEKTVIVYPRATSDHDLRSNYPVALLNLALTKADVSYELRPSALSMQQNRALRQLVDNMEIDVVWAMTSTDREKELLPVRIAIDKGLLGSRIFLINRESQEKLEQVQTLEQLKLLTAGQQHDWPDSQILMANGLKVSRISSYESMFKMLQLNRIDYIPRSITEIWDEEAHFRAMDIMVEKNILMQYPVVEYFFVNKKNKFLAGALEKGLRIAMADGSFDEIFTKYNGEAIKRSNLANRKVFKLVNPLSSDPYETR